MIIITTEKCNPRTGEYECTEQFGITSRWAYTINWKKYDTLPYVKSAIVIEDETGEVLYTK